ncbi:MAG: leucine-rich repeat domain-containing protein [Muribaculaceae bacterium]|nr:leucine-rich repeat domain-containing protein [Muribaculaceae bacterium]
MKKILLSLMSLLAMPPITHAQRVNIGDVIYEVNGEEATVAYSWDAAGDISILPEVEIEGEMYPVTSISYGAFGAHVKGHREYIVAITSVDIPSSVVSIDDNAFTKSTLTEITVPETVKKIGNYVFKGCTDLRKAVIEGGKDSLGMELFNECIALESAVIGEGHTVVPEYTFAGCKALSDVELPSSLKEIKGSAELGGAFIFCSSLQTIDLPEGLTSIGIMGFHGSGLTSIVLPESLTNIGESAFSGCYYLESAKLPSSLEVLPKSMFRHCRSLESITIPASVTVIEGGEYNEGCFDHCSSLKHVTLSKNLKEIKGYAFNACSIDSIVIPETVTEIGYKAFCPVKDIEMRYVKCFAKEPPVLGESVFFESEMPSGLEVFIPESSLELYRNADVWKDFFLTGFDATSSVVPTAVASDDHWTVYGLDGHLVLDTYDYFSLSSLVPGFYIINGKKQIVR